MPTLKMHRKAKLELEGRKLKGSFEISLSNAGDREELMSWLSEIRKQLKEHDKAKASA